MSISSFLFGNKDQFKQLPTKDKAQLGILSQIINQLSPQGNIGQNYNSASNYISQMLNGSPEAFERFAAPYKTQFEQQTIPGIAERFAGLGGGLGGGALGSSGFAQALGGAGAQFQSNLAGLYAQLQQQAAQQAMGQYGNFANLGLGTNTFENVYRPGSTGALGGLLAGVGQGIGSGFGMPMGASLISKFFGNPAQPQQTPKENINDFEGYW